MDTKPWSELFSEAGQDWASREAAASLLEDSKSAVMAQRQTALGDMPVNRQEQYVKASPEWSEYIQQTVEARREANLAKVQMETMRMRFQESMNLDANNRAEARLMT